MSKILWPIVCITSILAFEADAATLRPQSVVRGDVIHVGDLFDGAGPAARAVAAPAPAPGRKEVFDLRRLSGIAARHGLDWTPRGRYIRAVVERAGAPIDQGEIEKRLTRALRAKGVVNDVRVKIFSRNLNLQADPAGREPFWFENIRYDDRSGRFAATMVIPAGDRAPARVKLSGRAEAVVAVPVLNRRIGRGEIVRKRDLVWRKFRKMRVRRNILLDGRAIAGLAARRPLSAGVPLREGDVEPPLMVARGSLVTLMLQTNQMMLTVRGKSLQAGARGQVIQVINIRSKRIIEGVVEGPGRVRVQTAASLSRNGGRS